MRLKKFKNFAAARAAEDSGEAIFCKRCGKITSTYPRLFPADGAEQKYTCMCCDPLFAKNTSPPPSIW